MSKPEAIGLLCAATLFAGGAHGPSARADDVAGETIVIEGKAPDTAARDRDRALGSAPFVSVLHGDDHAATASVADALATTAGATVRSLGGDGAFQSVSVRGAAPGQTQIVIDGVPLARLAQVTTDLGRFAIDSFGEVELYRGAVPIELGGAGAGGAINLVTRLGRGDHGELVRASVGGGSYGARHARLHYGDAYDGWSSSLTLGYQGANGDFSYFTDNGTPLNRHDDTRLVRANNSFDQLDAAARAGGSSWVAGLRGLWKQQGLPGSIAQPAMAAELSTVDVIADGRRDVAIADAVGRQSGYLVVERQRVSDPLAELGLGVQERGNLTLAAGASSVWARMFGDHKGTAGLELRGERFRDADRDHMRDPLIGTRVGAAGELAVDLSPIPAISVTPALRLDLVRTAPTPLAEGPDAFAAVAPRWDAVPSPRLTARALIGDDLALKSSAGAYVRLPTLVEVFGNHGVILGSPELRAEHGTTIDAGLVWAPAVPHGPADQLMLEAVAFGTRSKDTIALISSAGFVARAENVGSTESYGGELIGSLRLWKQQALTVAYTRLVTAQHTLDPSFHDKALPRLPGHQLYARTTHRRVIGGRAVELHADVAAQSDSFLDRANFQRVPGRALIGAGTQVALVRGVALAVAVANLTDRRVVELPAERAIDVPTPTPLSDVAGFPLPGRTVYLSVDWTH